MVFALKEESKSSFCSVELRHSWKLEGVEAKSLKFFDVDTNDHRRF
jgi:hypothetical protein